MVINCDDSEPAEEVKNKSLWTAKLMSKPLIVKPQSNFIKKKNQ